MKTPEQFNYRPTKYKRLFLFIFLLIAVVVIIYYIIKNLYYNKTIERENANFFQPVKKEIAKAGF
jgi:hypothetical protein